MSTASSQNYANHRRFSPLYHFVAVPILAANIMVSLYIFYRAQTKLAAWNVVVAIGLVVALVALRVSILTVQNRLIRLEMMLRLRNLLPAEQFGRVKDLRLGQLVGLRFASDAELPGLVQRCFDGELKSAGQIKREIKDWQADSVRA